MNSVSVEGDEGVYRNIEGANSIGTLELGQINDETRRDDLRSERAQQGNCCSGGSAGRNQIVDEQYFFATTDRITMDLHLVDAVLQGITDSHGIVREFPLFPDGDEASAELTGHGSAENETPCLDTGDGGDIPFLIGRRQRVDRLTKRRRMTE